jgi:hypothetical protein
VVLVLVLCAGPRYVAASVTALLVAASVQLHRLTVLPMLLLLA